MPTSDKDSGQPVEGPDRSVHGSMTPPLTLKERQTGEKFCPKVVGGLLPPDCGGAVLGLSVGSAAS